MSEFNTRLIHVPNPNDNNTGSVTVPIYKATTFAYPKIDADIEYDYSRSGNPTRKALEDQLASLENGTAAFAFSSGMAAIHAALAIFKQGDHIIVGKQIYGGTYRLLYQFFKQWGLEISAVDTRNLTAIESAIKANTKAIYFEPITNPLLQVSSIKKIADLVHQYNLLTIVDNTFLSPYLLKPLDYGADIVIHSATKYLSGHSDVSAGAIIVKDQELAQKVYFIQNAIGSILSPEDCNELMRGIKTLSVRLDRQIENTLAIFNFLKNLPEVDHIYYPGHPEQEGYEELHQEAKAAGSVLSFELNSAVDPVAFVNKLKIFTLAVSLGAVESLVELPSKMSHAELNSEEQLKAGIKPGLIRISVGIEDQNDLIADLKEALNQAKK
ncbi:trans-sulfuration enzyme family protein [Lactobacillus kalixensis]|uniref:trans-sulfuration enzyme family protein n=1 Tax=Lactobacillus kalixensis TaxID=227944 RepID=UPI00070AE3E9|nr:PLP-dependent aspartate aminotransferase family protein [Lactobacillus kalixensis]